METEKDLKTQKKLLKQQLQAYQRLAESVENEKFISNEIRKCINYELRQISLKLRFIETKEKIIQKYKKFPLTIQCGKYFFCVFDQYDLNFECNFNLNEKINSYLSYI